MSLGNLPVGSYKNLTATANIKGATAPAVNPGALLGFYVNSTSSGTIQFYDDQATGTGTPITGVITPAIGWNPLPVAFSNGLYAVIASTLNVTVSFV